MQATDLEGEYYLKGQMEMASGFLFKPGGEFQFFFSYGALDRQGSGKWELKDGKLKLNSAPKPAYDFALVKSAKIPGDGITIRIEKAGNMPLDYVYASLQNGDPNTWIQMSSRGEAEFPAQEVKTISLLFKFCPERFSTIPINKEHNEFIFRFEPTIMEVFFENFSLQVNKDGLSGGHPLMPGDEFIYEKQ